MSSNLIKTLIVIQIVVGSWQIQLKNTFGSCIKKDQPNLLSCAGQQAIETLQQLSDANNFTLGDGVLLSKDESIMGRNVPLSFVDQDPTDIR
jgi:hypothetical protein